MVIELPLTNYDGSTLIDDEFYEYYKRFKLKAALNNKGEPTSVYYLEKEYGKNVRILLHRAILMLGEDDPIVDHKDGNPLNNTVSNLRLCTYSQNSMNKRCSNSNGYKGVKKSGEGWEASISLFGKYKYLGKYKTILEAARAYDISAIENFGEFARTNNIPENIVPLKITTGNPHRGVYEKDGKFRVIVTRKGVRYNVGYYDDLDSAIESYNKKIKELSNNG